MMLMRLIVYECMSRRCDAGMWSFADLTLFTLNGGRFLVMLMMHNLRFWLFLTSLFMHIIIFILLDQVRHIPRACVSQDPKTQNPISWSSRPLFPAGMPNTDTRIEEKWNGLTAERMACTWISGMFFRLLYVPRVYLIA